MHVGFHMHLQCAMGCDVDTACNMWFYVGNTCYWGTVASAGGPGVTEYVVAESMRYFVIPSRIV